MKTKLLKWMLNRLWLLDPVEKRWWDEDDPVETISGAALLAALSHRRACA